MDADKRGEVGSMDFTTFARRCLAKQFPYPWSYRQDKLLVGVESMKCGTRRMLVEVEKGIGTTTILMAAAFHRF